MIVESRDQRKHNKIDELELTANIENDCKKKEEGNRVEVKELYQT